MRTTVQQKTTSTTASTTNVCQQLARFTACSSSARVAARDAAPTLCSTAPWRRASVSARRRSQPCCCGCAARAYLHGVEHPQRVAQAGFQRQRVALQARRHVNQLVSQLLLQRCVAAQRRRSVRRRRRHATSQRRRARVRAARVAIAGGRERGAGRLRGGSSAHGRAQVGGPRRRPQRSRQRLGARAIVRQRSGRHAARPGREASA